MHIALSIIGGLLWGSFLNVCIVRLPHNHSVVGGRSRCPHCNTMIPWYHNIPLISFCVLRAKCHHCVKPISIQYPLVEAGTALTSLLLYQKLGYTPSFACYALFASGLIVLSVIDLYYQIIPDEISLGGIALGFALSFTGWTVVWWNALLGILLGGGSLLAIAFLYEKLAHKEGLGGGDIKLLGMIGAWLGIQSLLPVVVLSSLFGSIVGLIYMFLQRKNLKTAIPFGPFLSIAALLFLLLREPMVQFLLGGVE